MSIFIKKFNELTLEELYEILELRSRVFVVEQNCPYNDLDYKDQKSIHLFKKIDEKIISYIRLLPKGVSYPDSPSVGRVVTNEEFRKKGYSRDLLKRGLQYIDENFDEDTVEISAQEYLVDFYKEFGFNPEGEVYLEDNLPHIHMVRKV